MTPHAMPVASARTLAAVSCNVRSRMHQAVAPAHPSWEARCSVRSCRGAGTAAVDDQQAAHDSRGTRDVEAVDEDTGSSGRSSGRFMALAWAVGRSQARANGTTKRLPPGARDVSDESCADVT